MIEAKESARLVLQTALDAAKTKLERNKLGQFATPTILAREMLAMANRLLPEGSPVRFLDPAIGTGSFYSALLKEFPPSRIASAEGYEVDGHYARPARELWAEGDLQLHVEDFTAAIPPAAAKKPNLIVCNPPYVRHHHLTVGTKKRLQTLTATYSDVCLSGLAGLYCHFLCICHRWLAPGGVAIWLIPSEFMDVNYGAPLKEYLLQKVTLERVHRFCPEDVQFADALVSSAVLCFRNAPPPAVHQVEFSYGGGLLEPKFTRRIPARTIAPGQKWSKDFFRADNRVSDTTGLHLGDLFSIKRGLATGDNSFFVLSEERSRTLPQDFLRPILPSPRFLRVEEVRADEQGLPLLEQRLFLLDCRLSEAEVERRYPALWSYLQEGKARQVEKGYLCTHRSPWYAQEDRETPPFLCTYMGREGNGRVFRFILNHSSAVATNVYLLLYPKGQLKAILTKRPELKRAVWQCLQSLKVEELTGVGRVYGGGLHKLEPKELANASAAPLLAALPELKTATLFDP